MRLIDDYAMQFSIYKLQTQMLNLDLANVSFQFDYAYGWLFWIVFALGTLPFRLLLDSNQNQFTEQLFIISVRSINVIILVLLTVIIYKIVQIILTNERIENRFVALLLSTSVMLSPAIGYWVGRPMPPLISITLLSLGILTGLTVSESNYKKFYLVAFIFGLSVGIKINYLIFVPLCMLLIKEINGKSFSLRPLKGNNWLKYPSLFALGIVLSSSPALLVNPFEAIPKYINVFNLFRKLSVSKSVGSFEEFWSNISNGVFSSSYGFFIYLFVVCILLFFLIDRYFLSKRILISKTLLLIFFLTAAIQISVSFFLGLGVVYVQSYSLPLVVLFLIFLALCVSKMKVSKKHLSSLSAFILLLISINFLQSIQQFEQRVPTINSYQKTHDVALVDGTYELQQKMQEEIKLKGSTVVIIQDYTLPTAWSGFRDGVDLTYSYDDWDKKYISDSVNQVYLFIDRKQHKLDRASYKIDSASMTTFSDSDSFIHKFIQTQLFLERTCELISSESRYYLYQCSF